MKEIVIKIPDKTYDVLTSSGVDWLGAEHILNAVANGKVLPKGHGRLIDADALDADNLNRGFDDNFMLHYGQVFLEDVESMIENASTVVEADKGDE